MNLTKISRCRNTSMIDYGVPYNARFVVLEKRRGHRSWATTNT